MAGSDGISGTLSEEFDGLKHHRTMSGTVTEEPAPTSSGTDWESSRREKLRRIVELGRDPWGSRFDDHAAIADIRARAGEIRYRLQDGREVALPDFENAG